MVSMDSSSSTYQRRLSTDVEPIETEVDVLPEITPEFDPELKTIVELGGGLSSSYITRTIPPDVMEDGNLSIAGIVDYMINETSIQGSEVTIKDNVVERLGQHNHMVMYNERQPTGGSTLTQTVSQSDRFYQEEIAGAAPFNYLKLAILTHEEGGR